jgi:hypothetical protein
VCREREQVAFLVALRLDAETLRRQPLRIVERVRAEEQLAGDRIEQFRSPGHEHRQHVEARVDVPGDLRCPARLRLGGFSPADNRYVSANWTGSGAFAGISRGSSE